MSYTKLLAWNESFLLAKAIYSLTTHFPPEERFGLVSQMRRAALSIPSNLAEGSRRGSSKEFKHFCSIAYGSASELEVQLRFSKELDMAPAILYKTVESKLDLTLCLLNGLTRPRSSTSS